MPSENWEELADHWFDLQCGCGGPVKASLLARKVQARLVPTRATCLIGGTSYLLHEDDLAASGEGEESERGLWSERFLEKDPPVERERALTVSSEGGSTDGASLSNGDPKARGVLEQQWQSGTQTTDEQLGSNAGTARTSFGRPGSVSNDETNNRDEHWEPDAAQIGPTNEFERCRLQERLDEESSSGERGEASGASSAPCCGNVDSAADVAVELGPERIRELAEGPIEVSYVTIPSKLFWGVVFVTRLSKSALSNIKWVCASPVLQGGCAPHSFKAPIRFFSAVDSKSLWILLYLGFEDKTAFAAFSQHMSFQIFSNRFCEPLLESRPAKSKWKKRLDMFHVMRQHCSVGSSTALNPFQRLLIDVPRLLSWNTRGPVNSDILNSSCLHVFHLRSPRSLCTADM